VKNRSSETIIRKPGEIEGKDFIIDGLKDCHVALFDYSAQVQIDGCVGCTFFIGPCEGSFFIRDCSSCKVIVMCGQFRTRDCHDVDALIHCSKGQPVIETSSNIQFGPFPSHFASYTHLNSQMKKANINPWDTEWSNVHDFSPSGEENNANWGFLDKKNMTEEQFFGGGVGEELELLRDKDNVSDLVLVPDTSAICVKNSFEEIGFVMMCGPEPEELAREVVSCCASSSSLHVSHDGDSPQIVQLLRSRSCEMKISELKKIHTMHMSASSAVPDDIKDGVVIGAEFGGGKGVWRDWLRYYQRK